MNESLSAKWGQLRGLQVVSIALGSRNFTGRRCGDDQTGTAYRDHERSYHGSSYYGWSTGRRHESSSIQ